MPSFIEVDDGKLIIRPTNNEQESGVYTIVVRVTDDNSAGSEGVKSASTQFQLEIAASASAVSQAYVDTYSNDTQSEVGLSVALSEVSNQGRVAIEFSEVMFWPERAVFDHFVLDLLVVNEKEREPDYAASMIKSWTAVETSGNTMQIEIEFLEPTDVSMTQTEADKLRVTFLRPSFFRVLDENSYVEEGLSLVASIPTQILASDERALEINAKIGAIALMATMPVAIVFRAVSGKLWNTLSALQIICHLPLI